MGELSPPSEKPGHDGALLPAPLNLHTPKPRSRYLKLVKPGVVLILLWVFLHRWLSLLSYGSFFTTLAELQEASEGVTSAFQTRVPYTRQWAEGLFLYVRLYHICWSEAHSAWDCPRTVPNSASAIAASRQYATKPHLAGSSGDLATAEDFLSLLQRELGIPKPDVQPVFSAGSPESRNATLSIPDLSEPSAWIDIYYPVMNTPLNHSVEILGDTGEVAWAADLEEVSDETDPDAWAYADAVTTWHGLSRGGDVQGKLINANYGRKEDFEDLVNKGMSELRLEGMPNNSRTSRAQASTLRDPSSLFAMDVFSVVSKCVCDLSVPVTIVCHAFSPQVKGAQELGAAGILIYSDPRDDGTVTVDNGYKP